MKNLMKAGLLALGIAVTLSSCNLFGDKAKPGTVVVDTLKKDTLKTGIDSLKKDTTATKKF